MLGLSLRAKSPKNDQKQKYAEKESEQNAQKQIQG